MSPTRDSIMRLEIFVIWAREFVLYDKTHATMFGFPCEGSFHLSLFTSYKKKNVKRERSYELCKSDVVCTYHLSSDNQKKTEENGNIFFHPSSLLPKSVNHNQD